MEQLTRRRFLGWTSAGAAGAGLLALAPRFGVPTPGAAHQVAQTALAAQTGSLANAWPALPSTSAANGSPALPTSTADPIVAYIHNAASGELSLMVGTREMTIHDPDLVARLFQRAGSGR
jgi:hypothetical protein